MKIKSVIETANSRYVVLDDVDTIFNKMNDPYFFSYFRNRKIMPDWIYAALFLAILALVILLVGGL